MSKTLTYDDWLSSNNDINEALWNGTPINFYDLLYKWGYSEKDIQIGAELQKELEKNSRIEDWEDLIVFPKAYAVAEVNESNGDYLINVMYKGGPKKYFVYLNNPDGELVKVSFGKN